MKQMVLRSALEIQENFTKKVNTIQSNAKNIGLQIYRDEKI